MNDSVQTQMLEHLENKYEEKFEIISFYAKDIDAAYDEATCKNSNGQTVVVYSEVEDGNRIFQDNYYGVLKESEYKTFLSNIIDEYISKHRLYSRFTANYFDNKYNNQINLLDAMMDQPMQFFSRSYIFVPQSAKGEMSEKKFEELCTKLQSAGIDLFIAVYCVPDEIYDTMADEDDVDLYIEQENQLYKKTIK